MTAASTAGIGVGARGTGVGARETRWPTGVAPAGGRDKNGGGPFASDGAGVTGAGATGAGATGAGATGAATGPAAMGVAVADAPGVGGMGLRDGGLGGFGR
jgi:hypothetical protein